jgi:hypothetical protein
MTETKNPGRVQIPNILATLEDSDFEIVSD